MDNDFAVAVDLRQPLRHFVLRNRLSADLGNLVLVGFADIDQVHVLAGVDAALQLLHADLRNSILQSLLLGGLGCDATELPIIDKLGHCRMQPADRALGILAQLQLAEAHGEGVDQQ